MNAATVRVLSSSTDNVSVPTIPLLITPGLKVEIDAIVWSEKLFAAAKGGSADVARFAAGL